MVSFCCNRFNSDLDLVSKEDGMLIGFLFMGIKFTSWVITSQSLYRSSLGKVAFSLSKYSGAITVLSIFGDMERFL